MIHDYKDEHTVVHVACMRAIIRPIGLEDTHHINTLESGQSSISRFHSREKTVLYMMTLLRRDQIDRPDS